jgi:hypothetical protein
MPKYRKTGRSLLAVVAAAGAIGGLAMSTEIRMAAADSTSVSASAKASSSSSSSSSATSSQKGGDCQATASAEVTTTVNGQTKTIRQENTDRGCSANAKAKVGIDGSQTDDSTAE